MTKRTIGLAKMKNNRDNRLERGRTKAERKRMRHANCELFFTTGRHKPELDTNYCDQCLRPFKLWF